MYLFFGLFLILCLFFLLLGLWRIRRITRRIHAMDCCERLQTLDALLGPFGFSYQSEQDVITSAVDAWQRNFGYHTLFDKTAPRFHMVFQREPVYFNYDNRTWLIEFWKGQYGINTGGEIGIYYADTLLQPNQYEQTLFHSIPDEKLLNMSLELYRGETLLFSLCRTHWWLTGFCTGQYSRPEELSLRACITFPNVRMLQSFTEGLVCAGYDTASFRICRLTVSLVFSVPHARQFHPAFYVWRSCWQNRLFCCLYRFLTRRFVCTGDRLLYLYYFLPAAFRHMLFFRKNRRQKKPDFKSLS